MLRQDDRNVGGPDRLGFAEPVHRNGQNSELMKRLAQGLSHLKIQRAALATEFLCRSEDYSRSEALEAVQSAFAQE
jgi:hypothetical protein